MAESSTAHIAFVSAACALNFGITIFFRGGIAAHAAGCTVLAVQRRRNVLFCIIRVRHHCPCLLCCVVGVLFFKTKTKLTHITHSLCTLHYPHMPQMLRPRVWHVG